jgi:biotin carboxyl carrier protein
MKKLEFSAQIGSEERVVTVEPLDEGAGGVSRWKVTIGGEERIVDARRVAGGDSSIGGGPWSILIDGKAWNVDLDPAKDGDILAEVGGRQATVKVLDARRKLLVQAQQTALKARGAQTGPLPVRAPMPGKVVKVLVKQGDKVTTGQGVAVVEAMKMENELRAPRDGTVTKIHVSEGQAVEPQEPLVTLE